MGYADARGVRIAYEDDGAESDIALLCLSGWAQDQDYFTPIATRLRERHRVITMDWRGHGDSDRVVEPFGHEEFTADALAVIEASGARRIIPVAQAHGGWVAVDLRRRLGDRVLMTVVTSWLVLEAPPPFLAALQLAQDPDRWQEARELLLSIWLQDAPSDVGEPTRTMMGAYDFGNWSRAGKAITADYSHYGSPLRALSALEPKMDVLHLFCQPRAPEYLTAQQDFAAANPWFSVKHLDGVSHFPPVELPDATVADIDRFVAEHASQ